MLGLGGRVLADLAPETAARTVLPSLMYARELSWAIGLDLVRALAPGGDAPEVRQPFYTSQFLVQALTQVLHAPAPTPAKLALRTVRHAEQANRETVVQVAQVDKRCQGWARVNSGGECGFCLMLVSRGPVYRTEQSGGFQSHDRCRCSATPVYGQDWAGREQYEQASAVYTQAAKEPGSTLANLQRIQRQRNSEESSA